MAEVDENWGDTLAEEDKKAEAPTAAAAGEAKPKVKVVLKPKAAAVVEQLADTLATTTIEAKNDDPEAKVEQVFLGIHPGDQQAAVDIQGGKGVDLSIYKAAKTFEELGLSKELLDGVYAKKFVSPSKIQAQALPIILAKDRPNLIGQAQAGSGKTAVYSLGMLSHVDPSIKAPQAICVCPTRELTIQVCKVVTELAKYTEITAALAVKQETRGANEKITAQIVIGTPGTLLAKIRHKELVTKNVRIFVADEADQMISAQGLGEQTTKIKSQLNKDVQILLFSATYSDRMRKFATKFAAGAIKIHIKREDESLESVQQFFMDCQGDQGKYDVLTSIYGFLNIGQSMIFVHTVATAKDLANKMRQEGYTVSLLHGKDMGVNERDAVMEDFNTGKTTVLISTNVLARGIDVPQVTLVINYDIPLNRQNKPDPETYVHRVGRAGRFGRPGVAINFVHDQLSKNNLRWIAQFYMKDITQLPVDDLEACETKIKEALTPK